MTKPRLAVLVAIVFAAAASRLLPHPPNTTPIAALALFGGATFSDKRLAFLVPLAALFASDLAIGFYNNMAFVYGSFAAIVCIGLWLRNHRSGLPIAGAAIASSILFFLVTNFGTWASSGIYPKTLAGLEACYVAGIPFFRNTAMGDLIYTAALFGGFSLLEKAFPVLAERQTPALAT